MWLLCCSGVILPHLWQSRLCAAACLLQSPVKCEMRQLALSDAKLMWQFEATPEGCTCTAVISPTTPCKVSGQARVQEVQERLRRCQQLEADIRSCNPHIAASKSPTPSPPPVVEAQRHTTLLQVLLILLLSRCMHAQPSSENILMQSAV